MENRRILLLALIGVVLFTLYQNWQADYAKPPATAPAAQTAPLPSAGATAAADNSATATSSNAAPTQAKVRVQTDKLVAEIALAGGELSHLELSDYPVNKQHPQDKLALLDDTDGQRFVVQSGVSTAERVLAGPEQAFSAPQNEYRLAEGADTLEVPLEYQSADGYTVRKVYSFKRGSYEIGLSQTLVNHSGQALNAGAYARLLRNPPPPPAGPGIARTAGSFAGLGVYEQKTDGSGYRFKKVAFKDLEKNAYAAHQTGGWLAMLQHYFIVAIIAPEGAADFSGNYNAGRLLYSGQYSGALAPVAAGAEYSYALKFYVGPEAQGSLEAVAPGFELTEDYGLLTPIAKPLFWVLKAYNKLTGNWGWAIILLTCTVRLIFFPLSAAQYRSMAKMRKFGPRIAELRERFADDRERLNQAMMDLYKKEGFNPLAGCWPLLVQMPVFFSLYWVLAQSVELRQAPFILWMQDLSAADPFYVMPVLYGASMWAQQKLSGQAATMDPQQARIMNIMPIALTGFFVFFPVGLVLYWFVSNMINIGQQQIITRRLEKQGLGKKS